MSIHMMGHSCVLFIQANLPCLPNQESSDRALISARCRPKYLQQQAGVAGGGVGGQAEGPCERAWVVWRGGGGTQ